MYLNRKQKRVIVSAEEAHAKALIQEEELEVDWMVDWASEARGRMVKISCPFELNNSNGISTGTKQNERSGGTRG
jgi:hypothetical protein